MGGPEPLLYINGATLEAFWIASTWVVINSLETSLMQISRCQSLQNEGKYESISNVVVDVRNSGRNTSYLCKCGKPIYVGTGSDTFDGSQTNHET